MRRNLIILLLLCCLQGFAQLVTVTSVYEYWSNNSKESRQTAEMRAFEQARIDALSRKFGVDVSEIGSSYIKNNQVGTSAETTVSVFSTGVNEVKGEWVETIKEEVQECRYENDFWYIKVFVKGKVRAKRSADVQVNTAVLRNGFSSIDESDRFGSGDHMYLRFSAPVDGSVCVYLVDETQTAFCLLPDNFNHTGYQEVEANKEYVFFSLDHSNTQVDEYILTTDAEIEHNILYVVFSPNRIFKASDSNVVKNAHGQLMPRSLPYSDFLKWLAKCQTKDEEMVVKRDILMIHNAAKAADATKSNASRNSYQEFVKQARSDYDAFRHNANMQYAKFLRSAWERGLNEDTLALNADKDVAPQPYDASQTRVPMEVVVPLSRVVEAPLPQRRPQPVVPVKERQQPDSVLTLNFYGTTVNARYPKGAKLKLKSIAPDQISAAWCSLSDKKYDNFLYDCLKAREELELCDWAYLQLVRAMAKEALGSTNEAVMLASYVYVNSGYKMRLAQSDSGRLYIMAGSDYRIYNYPYYEIEGSYFYPIECNEKNLSIAQASYTGELGMSMSITQPMNLQASNTVVQEIGSSNMSSATNLNLMEFYNNYPTSQLGGDFGTRWAMYANAPVDKTTEDMLYPMLRKAIMGMDEVHASNLLLNWVQSAFKYEADESLWGKDRAMFAEETLFYQYADCEDRAILFSHLVRDLLGLDVVLVYYPGHLATAVNFHSNVKGDYFVVDNVKYIVCDPSYMGAPVGATMPNMDNNIAKIIKLKI